MTLATIESLSENLPSRCGALGERALPLRSTRVSEGRDGAPPPSASARRGFRIASTCAAFSAFLSFALACAKPARAEDAQAPAGPASATLIQTIRGNAPSLKPEQIKTGNVEKGRCESMESPFLVRCYSNWVYVIDPARHGKETGGTQLHQFDKAADGTVTFKRDLPYPKELEACGYNACANLFFRTLPNEEGIAYLSTWGWGGGSALWWFRVDKNTGEMKAVDKTNAPTGAMTLSPDGKFLYLAGEDKLQGFSLNRETGTPTPLPAGPKTYGFNMVLSDDGKFAHTIEHDTTAEVLKQMAQLQAVMTPKQKALKQAERDLRKNPADAEIKKRVEDQRSELGPLEKEMTELRKSDNWSVCTRDRDPVTGTIGPARNQTVMAETQELGLCGRRDFLHVVLSPNGTHLLVLWQDGRYDVHWSSYARNAAAGTVRFESTRGKDAVWYKQELVVSPDRKRAYYGTYWEGGGLLGSFEWDEKDMYKNLQKIPAEGDWMFQSVDLDAATRTLYAVDGALSKLMVFRLP